MPGIFWAYRGNRTLTQVLHLDTFATAYNGLEDFGNGNGTYTRSGNASFFVSRI